MTKRPTFTDFFVRYYTIHRPGTVTVGILSQTAHPLHRPTHERIAQRDRNSLWHLVSGHFLSTKKVVRSRACRKLRVALLETLRANGYDDFGRPVSSPSSFSSSLSSSSSPSMRGEDGEGPGRKRPLRGSLHIFPHATAAAAGQESLRADMERLLRFVEETQARRTRSVAGAGSYEEWT